MIHANCRARLTADDFDFVVGVLGKSEKNRASLATLLADEEERDRVLDCEGLSQAILDDPERLGISPQFMFYVLCRKVLRSTSVQSREAADFVASMLENFQRTSSLERPKDLGQRSWQYMTDMMQALEKANTHESFLLRSHIANYSLFTSGMFAENLVARTHRRGAPDLKFYEEMGRMNYRAAAEYREAKKFNLQRIYEELSDGFHEVRVALNDLAIRLLHLDSQPQGPLLA